MTNSSLVVVYHYTVGLKLRSIAQDDYLMLTPSIPKLGEKPVVWLSTEPFYEPTANKMIMGPYDERPRLSTMEEMVAQMGGIYRFGFDPTTLPPDTVVPWVVLKNRARMPKKIVNRLLKRARGVKARPSHWYGTMRELSIANATLEVLDLEQSQWVPTTLSEALTIAMPYDRVQQLREHEMPKGLRATDEDWSS